MNPKPHHLGPKVSRPGDLSAGHALGLRERWLAFSVSFFLALVIWVAFGRTVHHEFVNYDDDAYIYDNPMVQKGVTVDGLCWAFTTVHAANWHPVTWLTHLLDCQCYGLNAGGHHLTNVLLHTATVIALFLVLRSMTGLLWRSALVAVIFAIHPLRVESVAWVAERKDVLSGLFFLLTISAYVRYVRQPWSWSRYLLVALLLALALMAKPMVVTLPFVLLLLDYWPLKRFNTVGSRLIPWRLIFEKLPLLALCVAASLTTLWAQHEARSAPLLSVRLSNALVSYVVYLGQMFYPADLAVFYPYPVAGLAAVKIVMALVCLFIISAVAVILRQRQPWLLVGWLWYLGMLVPVIGIIQVGAQWHADRYTYLPQIGLYFALVWLVAETSADWPCRRWALGSVAAAILVPLVICARAQTAYWRNSEILWMHTLACTANNLAGHINLGNILVKEGKVVEAEVHYQAALQIQPNNAEALVSYGYVLMQQGRTDEAIRYFQQALAIKPNAQAHNNLGSLLVQKGRDDEAIAQFRRAVQIKPDYAEACYNLGNAIGRQGDLTKAIGCYRKALQIRPNYAEACFNLGNTLFQKGDLGEAVASYQQALKLRPDYAKAHYQLGNALMQKGRENEAVAEFQQAVRLKPDFSEALNDLAWELATSSQASLRNGQHAVELALRANQLTGGADLDILGTLAAAYAEAGRFDDAIACARKAIDLAQAAGQPDQLGQLNCQLKLYESGHPFHRDSQ